MQRILVLFQKYRAVITYLFFGGITTLVNLVAYWFCFYQLNLGNDPSVVLALAIAILVAFLTNKPFVFESHDWSPKVLFPEAFSFFSCRIGTGVMEYLLMHLLVEVLGLFPMLMKLLVNILVIVLNYVFSKLLVFRKK